MNSPQVPFAPYAVYATLPAAHTNTPREDIEAQRWRRRFGHGLLHIDDVPSHVSIASKPQPIAPRTRPAICLHLAKVFLADGCHHRALEYVKRAGTWTGNSRDEQVASRLLVITLILNNLEILSALVKNGWIRNIRGQCYGCEELTRLQSLYRPNVPLPILPSSLVLEAIQHGHVRGKPPSFLMAVAGFGTLEAFWLLTGQTHFFKRRCRSERWSGLTVPMAAAGNPANPSIFSELLQRGVVGQSGAELNKTIPAGHLSGLIGKTLPIAVDVACIDIAGLYGHVQAIEQICAWPMAINRSRMCLLLRLPEDTLLLLLRSAADPDQTDSNGNNPLHLAVIWGYLRYCVVLAECYGHILGSRVNGNGQTALHLAAIQGQSGLYDLLSQYTRQGIKDFDNRLPSDYLTRKDNKEELGIVTVKKEQIQQVTEAMRLVNLTKQPKRGPFKWADVIRLNLDFLL